VKLDGREGTHLAAAEAAHAANVAEMHRVPDALRAALASPLS
jgi:hypothetical protein